MARGIRLTKAERGALRFWLENLGNPPTSGPTKNEEKLSASILQKLLASEEKQAGVDIVPIEEALVAAARGKVLALEGGHAMASVRAAQLKATPEQATLVGQYLARTAYFTQPMTVLDVFNKWFSWLPKARATQPPPALTPGLGADAPDGRGPAPTGQKAAGGRTSQGFR